MSRPRRGRVYLEYEVRSPAVRGGQTKREKQMKNDLGVGIYGARIRGRSVSWKGKKGRLTCRKCGSERNLCLFDGGVCRCCWKPENIKKPNSRWVRNYGQSGETKALKAKIVELMTSRGITLKDVARMLEIPRTSLANWFRGQFGEEGQKNMAARIGPKLRG